MRQYGFAVLSLAFVVAVSGCPSNTVTGTKDMSSARFDFTTNGNDDLTGGVADLTGGGGDGGGSADFGGSSDGGVVVDLKGADLTTVGVDAGTITSKCASPPAITITNNTGTINVDTNAAVDDTSGTCAGSGPENVYRLTLAMAQKVTIVATPDGSSTSWQPIVYLRSDCASEASSAEFGCDGVDTISGSPTTLVINNLVSGSYFLFLDGYSGSRGAGTVTVTFDTALPPPANDSCAGAAVLDLTSGTATASLDTSAATDDDYTSVCGGDGPDTIYQFTLTSTQAVTALVTPDSGSPTWAPVLSFRSVCADYLTETSCNAASTAGAATTLVANALGAGTYYLWVDGDNGSAGKGALLLTRSMPIPGEDCTAPAPLTFTSNVATASVDTTSFAATTYSDGCGGSGNDMVFSFTTTGTQRLDITVTPDSSSTSWDPVLYLRTACADETGPAEVACDEPGAGLAASLAINSLPAGTYFVWVDGYASSMGKGTLTATLSTPLPPPTNESCTAPLDIKLGETLMSDTSLAVDQMGATISTACDVNNSGDFPGPDVVYVYTPLASGTATFTVHPISSWDPALWVMNTTCTDAGSTCTNAIDKGLSGGDETITLAVTSPTPYYLVVDSYSTTARGPFTLNVK